MNLADYGWAVLIMADERGYSLGTGALYWELNMSKTLQLRNNRYYYQLFFHRHSDFKFSVCFEPIRDMGFLLYHRKAIMVHDSFSKMIAMWEEEVKNLPQEVKS